MSEQRLQTHSNLSYLGNINVKRDGVEQQWTQEEINEYAKCLRDPVYFAERYIKVISLDDGLVPFNLYPYQREMFEHFNSNRFSIVLACRQSGKCQSINSTIRVMHRGTNEEYTLTFGEFEQLLTSDYKSDNRRIHAEEQRQTSALEQVQRGYYNSARYDIRTEEANSCYTENDSSEERVREVFTEFGDRSDVSDLWDLYQEQDRPAHSKSTLSRYTKLFWRTLVKFIKAEVFRKSGRRKESMSQSWRQIQSVFKKLSKLFKRNNTKSCSESFLHDSSGLLYQSGNDRRRSESGSCRKTENIHFGEMFKETWRRWLSYIRGSSKSLAKYFEVKAARRNRSDQNGSINWKNEPVIQFGSKSKIYSGNSLCYQIYELQDIGDILESRNNIKNSQQKILDSGHDEKWHFTGTHLCLPINILQSLQVGTTDTQRKQSYKNNCFKSLVFNNRGIYERTKLSDTVERKFVKSYDSSDYLIWTDTGWEKLQTLNKTVKYEKYTVIFDDGTQTEVADTHIFFDSNLNEVFAKDSLGCELYGEFGHKTVVDVIATGCFENMYDVSIDSENHRYYSDGVLSHNSISSVVYLLWYAIFNPEKTIAILANKGSTAKEMLARVTLALENLPFFLQPGCKALNKTSIEFSNNSRIIAASTSSSSIRGMSVNLLFLDEFAFVQNDAEFYTSTYPVVSSGKDTKIIITSTANGLGNVFHKLWEGAVQKTNNFVPFRVDWWDVPGRDEKWKEETIANTSQLQFNQEYGNCLESRSQITILINNIVYEIAIGDLYNAIRRKDSSGLSLDEEVRLSAIRWYHYKR